MATSARAASGLRERKRRALRARLVAIAGERFLADGYDATNMRAVADAAGVAYQTLYNHFPNKARLALAWVTTRLDEATSAAGALAAIETGDPLASILAAADHYVRFVDGIDRRLWREATSEYLHAPEQADEVNAFELLGPATQLRELLERERRAGTLAPETDVATLADVLFVLIDHAILRFVVLEEMTPEGALEELHAQLELVLGPRLTVR
ncbi:MAG: TetR/AcrR family transcriptional regulator [Pseudomonadales bacterium]|jgi:AcrR family transcriptional regulator|nr:TetR/AcrR family transcriptional regulator [Pseudomonadales bacterium]